MESESNFNFEIYRAVLQKLYTDIVIKCDYSNPKNTYNFILNNYHNVHFSRECYNGTEHYCLIYYNINDARMISIAFRYIELSNFQQLSMLSNADCWYDDYFYGSILSPQFNLITKEINNVTD